MIETKSEELIKILRSRDVNELTLRFLQKEEFDGESFLELTQNDLEKTFKLGTMKKLSKIIKEFTKNKVCANSANEMLSLSDQEFYMKELENELFEYPEKSFKIHGANFHEEMMFTSDESRNKFCSEALLFLFKQYLRYNINKNEEKFLNKYSRFDFRSQMLKEKHIKHIRVFNNKPSRIRLMTNS